MYVSDSEHVETSRRPGPPEVSQSATYNYRSLDHQAGPNGGQSGVTIRGGNALLRQENSGTTTAKSRAGKFSEKAKKKASSLTPEEVAAKKAALARLEKENRVGVLEKRIQDRLSRRVDHLPSPEDAQIPRDKLDGYALNSAHEEGHTKAAGFAKAGFPLVNAWENRKPEVHRAAADADPRYLEGRDSMVSQIKGDLPKVHATRQDGRGFESYYTRHNLVAPGTDASRSVVAKAAWLVKRNADGKEQSSLTTIMPRRYSTDEDIEKLDKLKKELNTDHDSDSEKTE